MQAQSADFVLRSRAENGSFVSIRSDDLLESGQRADKEVEGELSEALNAFFVITWGSISVFVRITAQEGGCHGMR